MATVVTVLGSMLWAEVPKGTPAPTPAPAKRTWKGDFADMVKQITPPLSDKTLEKLGAISDNMDKTAVSVDADIKKQIDPITKDKATAKSDAAKAADDAKIASIQATRDTRLSSFRAQALKLLTPDQKTSWVTFKFQTPILGEFKAMKDLKFSDEQNKSIATMFDLAAQLPEDKLADANKVTADLRDGIVKILDDSQKQKYKDYLATKDGKDKGKTAGK